MGETRKNKGEMVKGNHPDGPPGNPSTQEQGGRALEGRKSMQRISCLVRASVFREGRRESAWKLVTGTHKTKPMGKHEVINTEENRTVYEEKRLGPVCLTLWA